MAIVGKNLFHLIWLIHCIKRRPFLQNVYKNPLNFSSRGFLFDEPTKRGKAPNSPELN